MLNRKALLSLDVALTELLHEEINYPIKPLLKVLQQTLWLLHLNTRKPRISLRSNTLSAKTIGILHLIVRKKHMTYCKKSYCKKNCHIIIDVV